MATAPQTAQLPLFYNDLMPLNTADHGTWHARGTDKAKWLVNQHAVPLTVEEFPQAQRFFPIIFSAGDSRDPELAGIRGAGHERRRQRVRR